MADSKRAYPRFGDSDETKPIKSKYQLTSGYSKIPQEFYIRQANEDVFDKIFSGEIDDATFKNDNGTFRIFGTGRDGKTNAAMIGECIGNKLPLAGVLRLSSVKDSEKLKS
jgi:hypothetical protein